jgi:hypothetical protein
MFMFCLVFAVCLVSCGGSGNMGRQFNPENRDGNHATSGPARQATDVSDSADSRLLVDLGKEYVVTFSARKDCSDGTKKGTVTIKDEVSGAEAFVNLNVSEGNWDDANGSIKANAKELGIKINGDNRHNKTYVIIFKQDEFIYNNVGNFSHIECNISFIMYHDRNLDSFRPSSLSDNPSVMRIFEYSYTSPFQKTTKLKFSKTDAQYKLNE